MARPSGQQPVVRAAAPILAALLTLAAYRFIGNIYLDDFELDLGRLTTPARKYTYFLGVWFFFGAVASGFLTVGIARLVSGPGRVRRLVDALDRVSDRSWVLALAALAFGVPLTIRIVVLDGAPLTDDEGAYRFMAECIAGGRLYADSHEMREFFHRKFLINDGKMYAQYFVGWPALMAPGVWFGQAGFMNAVYSGLTAVPLYYVVRRSVGSRSAKLSSLLLVSAPMLIIGAATEMSHTSCLAALAWLHLSVLRSTDDDAPWWSHAAVAALFSTMFFNRPTPALGAGTPLLIYWFYRTWSRSWGQRLIAWSAFGVTAAAFGAAFLGVNYVQNGAPFKSSYARAIEFARETNYRFWGGPKREGVGDLFRTLDPADAKQEVHTLLLATVGAATVRLNFAVFGWPCSYLFALFAWGDRSARLAAASFLGVFVVHSFVKIVGVDSIGPVKYFESAFPLMVLSGIGLHRATDYLTKLGQRRNADPAGIPLPVWPGALLVALILTSTQGYTRARLAAVGSMAEKINIPRDAAEQAQLENAIVFAARNFSPRRCSRRPTHHFVFLRPANDPELKNSVLWVNNLRRPKKLELLEYFPDRTPYMMRWTKACEVIFKPFAAEQTSLKPHKPPDSQ